METNSACEKVNKKKGMSKYSSKMIHKYTTVPKYHWFNIKQQSWHFKLFIIIPPMTEAARCENKFEDLNSDYSLFTRLFQKFWKLDYPHLNTYVHYVCVYTRKGCEMNIEMNSIVKSLCENKGKCFAPEWRCVRSTSVLSFINRGILSDY